MPDAPTGLAATGGNAQVGLSWSAPLANGGSPITSYRISRSTSPGTETFLVSTPTNATTYTDSTAVNGTTYYYVVAAVNAVGFGASSGEASATPAAPALLLDETFESGSLSGWTRTGPLAIDSVRRHGGLYAAKALCSGSACWAYRSFDGGQTASDLYARAWVYVAARDSKTTTLFKLRTAGSGSGTSVIGLLLDNKGQLDYRNDAAGRTVNGTHVISTGIWHRITVHLVVGSAGHIDVWLDGTPLSELSGTANFGTTAIGRIQVGENQSGRTFDVSFDDLSASTSVISP